MTIIIIPTGFLFFPHFSNNIQFSENKMAILHVHIDKLPTLGQIYWNYLKM